MTNPLDHLIAEVQQRYPTSFYGFDGSTISVEPGRGWYLNVDGERVVVEQAQGTFMLAVREWLEKQG